MCDTCPILVFAATPDVESEVASALEGLEGGHVRTPPDEAAWEPALRECALAVVDGSHAPLTARVARLVRSIAEPDRPGVLLVVDGGVEQAPSLVTEYAPDDFVERPLRPLELRARVQKLLKSAASRRALAQRQVDATLTLELMEVLASSLELRHVVRTLVGRLAEHLRVQRASIVLVDDEWPNLGHVVAASDDESLTDLELDLGKYPELREALASRRPLSIEDARSHPLLDAVRDSVPASLGGLFLFPIVFRDAPLGVLVLRTTKARALAPREQEFCGAIAHAAAVALRNARVLQRLIRDRDTALAEATHEAELRGRALEAYQDLFAAAPDGIAVFSPEGQLLFANPKAYEILGYASEELTGRKLYDLMAAHSEQELRSIWRSLPRKRLVTDVDLFARHKFGREVTLSTSFSVLDDHSVLVQFRDVTAERATEKELRKTKEFLESLINASIDAIVAADLRGTLILFNRGAERIYGYKAEDVLGSMHVSKLYPEGVAEEVMRKIRSPEFGGEGRLQSMHSCAVDRDGQLIPISLSAAMIYENNQPLATVGIFTDLREKILAEERLAQAQKKLEVSEKQALLAELAGTAAHELNQPLTSVMGYGELLARKLPAGSPERNAAQVIVRETERMADLVRKIGRITRYETKSYVGDQRILDLEKASDEEK